MHPGSKNSPAWYSQDHGHTGPRDGVIPLHLALAKLHLEYVVRIRYPITRERLINWSKKCRVSKGISSSEHLPREERLRDPGLLSLEKVLEGPNSRLSIRTLSRTQRQALYSGSCTGSA